MASAEHISSNLPGRFAQFFRAAFETGILFMARDSDWLSLNYRDGEALPVWSDRQTAHDALPAADWGQLEIVEYAIKDFVSGFTTPPYDGLYISVMPDSTGAGRILPYAEFLDYLRDGMRQG